MSPLTIFCINFYRKEQVQLQPPTQTEVEAEKRQTKEKTVNFVLLYTKTKENTQKDDWYAQRNGQWSGSELLAEQQCGSKEYAGADDLCEFFIFANYQQHNTTTKTTSKHHNALPQSLPHSPLFLIRYKIFCRTCRISSRPCRIR